MHKITHMFYLCLKARIDSIDFTEHKLKALFVLQRKQENQILHKTLYTKS